MTPRAIATDRLVLRRWTDADREPFAELNADPDVVEFLAGPLTRAESDDLIDRIEATFDTHGLGWWAVEVAATGRFAGFTGLSPVTFEATAVDAADRLLVGPPAVEVGWRLARHTWGHGYASEAARAAVADGFERCGLGEILSFTAVDNVRSRRVMERVGMTHRPDEQFDHPRLPEGHRLRRHVLYRLPAPHSTADPR